MTCKRSHLFNGRTLQDLDFQATTRKLKHFLGEFAALLRNGGGCAK
jgi:hypothetical protein